MVYQNFPHRLSILIKRSQIPHKKETKNLYIIPIKGAVETPKRDKLSLLGVPAHRAFSPTARESPTLAITLIRLMKYLEQGVKGMLPSGCLPLWGRKGVTFPTAIRHLTNNGRKRVSTEPDKRKKKKTGPCFFNLSGYVIINLHIKSPAPT